MGLAKRVREAEERAEAAVAAAKLANARVSALVLRMHLEEGRRSLGDGKLQVVFRRELPGWARRVREWWRGRDDRRAVRAAAASVAPPATGKEVA